MQAARSLADLATEAPLPPRRAAAVALAVARHLGHDTPKITSPDHLDPDSVIVDGDGSVTCTVHATAAQRVGTAATPEEAAGAAIGRSYHLLLVGRALSSPEDAFEPYLRSTLPDEQLALLVRSAGEGPPQWPSPQDWIDVLAPYCGALAAPTPPAVRRRAVRTRVLAWVALIVVIAATVLTVVLAPGWLDDATEEGRVQSATPSAMSY